METKFLRHPVLWTIAVGVFLILGGKSQLRLVDRGLDLPKGTGLLRTVTRSDESKGFYMKNFPTEDMKEPNTWGSLQDQFELTDDQLRATFECTMGNGKAERVDMDNLRKVSITVKEVTLVLKADVCSDKH